MYYNNRILSYQEKIILIKETQYISSIRLGNLKFYYYSTLLQYIYINIKYIIKIK